jgi:acyl-CoA hydrolase
MTSKNPKDSLVVQSNLVLPNDTNMLNNLMGGRLLHQMDIVAAIAAQRHSENAVVTASVDHVSFNHGISLGSIITVKAWVTRSFNSSMEVKVEVFTENIPDNQKQFKSNEAYLTFVGVDKNMRPIKVPTITPETVEEQAQYDSALRRRQFRLLVAGKISPNDAPELRSFLDLQQL